MEFDLNFKQDTIIQRGDLLIAEPFMKDPNFGRSVVLICEHKEDEGSFGLVMNKQSMVTVDQVSDQLPFEIPLYVGGPVEQNTLHFIHKFDDLEGAIPLKNGLFWGGDYEQIKEFLAIGRITKENCRFFMGYSGWGSYQLKEEFEKQSWIVSHGKLNSILDIDPDELWNATLKSMGGKFKVLANYPVEPRWN